MRTYDWTYEKRACWRYFEANDLDRSQPYVQEGHLFGGVLSTHTYPSPEARWEAWLYDSTLWAIEMAEGGELVYALRGLLQATEYAARVPNGGGSTLSDIRTGMKNFIEESIRSAEQTRESLEAVLQDAREEQGLDVFLFRLERDAEQDISGIVRARNLGHARDVATEYLAPYRVIPEGQDRMDYERSVLSVWSPARTSGVLITTEGRAQMAVDF